MGFKLLNIILLLGRIDLIMKPRITFVNICVINDATEAPYIPITGINIEFKMTLTIAPVMSIFHRYLCILFARIQILRTAPK